MSSSSAPGFLVPSILRPRYALHVAEALHSGAALNGRGHNRLLDGEPGPRSTFGTSQAPPERRLHRRRRLPSVSVSVREDSNKPMGQNNPDQSDTREIPAT
jgi:hypothetical protein